MKFKERMAQLKTNVPAIFLAMKCKKTSVLAKLLAVITVGYALSPIDLIPDFIPILGYLAVDNMVNLQGNLALRIEWRKQ